MNENFPVTEDELEAIRFYMGDPDTVRSGTFTGGTKAYNTINALLHPGTDNESDKAKEGRILKIADRSQLLSYVDLTAKIYHAMKKYQCAGSSCPLVTYRLDRASSIERFLKSGITRGFFSTCKHGFLPEYARQKAGSIMLEAERDERMPFLDFEDIFGINYAKPQEAEVLLPFDMVVDKVISLPVTKEEAFVYRDINGNPPLAKYRIHLKPFLMQLPSTDELTAAHEFAFNPGNVSRAALIMDKLTSRAQISAPDEQFYKDWKANLHTCILDKCR